VRVRRLARGLGPLAIGLAAAAAHAADAPDPGTFAKGTWTFQTYAGYLNDLGPQDTAGGFATAGASYYFADNVSLGVEVSGYGFRQPGDDAVAGAAGVVLRHHLLRDDRTSVFIDVAFAPSEASARVPEGGTRFSFVTQSGVGVTRRLRGGRHLLLGVRFIHVSNANFEGDDRNPSSNGVSAYAGLLFPL
jgi:lipid A 3-O-deacylase